MTTESTRQTVTVSDVAAHAGVSRATVSYALTQPSRLSDEMLARVQASIAELGYVRNDAARRLRVGRSQALGLVVANSRNPFFAELASGVETEAARHGLFILLANADDNPERERQYLRFFESQQVNGVLIAPVGAVPEELVELRKKGTPFVLLGKPEGDTIYPSVSGDGRSGGRLATEHLISQGRRRLLFVGGPHPQVVDRRDGATDAVDAAASGITLETITVPLQTARAGEEIAEQLLRRGELPDGIFAGNDLLALGLMHRLIAAGVSIPQTLSLVGYDDIEFAELAIVPLTSVRHAGDKMGAAAVLKLLDADSSGQPEEAEFAPQLMVRQTSLRLT
ncbi:LacI family DNA-binding transcriptional regulator [Microbacterium yannicii]|uniref:LacI family DNA-binding transcriptional regulator n=1 Tax=Microbacterium yannicii TaxID=671622 RepID=A0ABP9M943_9MICO|nr:LacI family DNA-binding transcriptional regulator [Microbacterium yannicii]